MMPKKIIELNLVFAKASKMKNAIRFDLRMSGNFVGKSHRISALHAISGEMNFACALCENEVKKFENSFLKRFGRR